MSLSNTFETALLQLILANVSATGVGDSGGILGSGGAGDLWISLHTADPGEAGSQSTNEATYGSYARFQIPRSVSNWNFGTGTATNANMVQFPTSTGTTNNITFFGIGTESSGAGYLLMSGALTSTLSVTTNIQPTFAAGTLTITAD